MYLPWNTSLLSNSCHAIGQSLELLHVVLSVSCKPGECVFHFYILTQWQWQSSCSHYELKTNWNPTSLAGHVHGHLYWYRRSLHEAEPWPCISVPCKEVRRIYKRSIKYAMYEIRSEPLQIGGAFFCWSHEAAELLRLSQQTPFPVSWKDSTSRPRDMATHILHF